MNGSKHQICQAGNAARPGLVKICTKGTYRLRSWLLYIQSDVQHTHGFWIRSTCHDKAMMGVFRAIRWLGLCCESLKLAVTAAGVLVLSWRPGSGAGVFQPAAATGGVHESWATAAGEIRPGYQCAAHQSHCAGPCSVQVSHMPSFIDICSASEAPKDVLYR